MQAREFCFWLQGYFEITAVTNLSTALTVDQASCIQKHLSMVFVHEIDPSYKEQDKLNKIHNPTKAKEDITKTLMRC